MTIILTAAGFGTGSKEFNSKIRDTVTQFTDQVYPLEWQEKAVSQKLQSLFDTRSSREIYEAIFEQISGYFENKDARNHNFVFITASAGSLVVENALSIFNIQNYTPSITHIMLAPAIGGSYWAEIGKFASMIASAILPTTILKSDKPWLSLILLGLSFWGIAKHGNNDRLLNDLSKKIETRNFSFANIPREIIFSSTDEIVNKPPMQIYHARYYEGNYSHSQVTSLENLELRNDYLDLQTTNYIRKLDIIHRTLI